MVQNAQKVNPGKGLVLVMFNHSQSFTEKKKQCRMLITGIINAKVIIIYTPQGFTDAPWFCAIRMVLTSVNDFNQRSQW